MSQKQSFSSSSSKKRLTVDNINPNVVEAKYAVRGELATKSEKYRSELQKGDSNLPFDTVISANIGNPQQLDQKPITFFRQVTSLLENPELLNHPDVLTKSLGYKPDVLERAKTLLEDVKSVGAYSQSQGATGIRQSVARFIERRDGFPADPDSIFLSAGASSGVNTLMNVICANSQSGILVPIPQYPLYTATLSLLNAKCVPYLLDEAKQWGTDIEAIKESLSKAKKESIDVRAIVIINPGNPTGSSLSSDEIKGVLDFAAENKLVVLADEVYQTNIFEGEFTSFKKCLRELQRDTPGKYDNVELASLHSISKGMVGECGHRGGYFELVGFDEEVRISLFPFRKQTALISDNPSGSSTNLQIRLHPTLRPSTRPSPSLPHGRTPSLRLPLLRPLQIRIRQHLRRPLQTRHRPLRSLQANGRRPMRTPSRKHVPLPHHHPAPKSHCRSRKAGQEPRRLLLRSLARCYGRLCRSW